MDSIVAMSVTEGSKQQRSAEATPHRALPHGARRAAFAALVLAPLLAVLEGCTVPPPASPPPAAPPPQPVPAPAPDPGEQARLHALLDAAEEALAADRLTTPPPDSAFRYYSLALEIAPDHQPAREGLERIVERYLELTAKAIGHRRWESARRLLDRAATVDEQHPGIAPLRTQVDLLAAAERRTLALDRTALRARQGAVARQLAAFGRDARRTGARVTIRAPNDATARWIYDQLSRAAGDQRIRGSIEIGLPPQVEVLLLPAATTVR